MGVSSDTKKAYEVRGVPSVRVLGEDGTVVGTDEADIARILSGS